MHVNALAFRNCYHIRCFRNSEIIKTSAWCFFEQSIPTTFSVEPQFCRRRAMQLLTCSHSSDPGDCLSMMVTSTANVREVQHSEAAQL